jgi:uroporphyrinogen decarboxylase
MTKRERLLTAVAGGKPDRVPVSIYQHSTARDRGTKEFARYTLDFHKKFDPDYVKVMYDELYDVPVNFQFATDPSVWEMLEPLDPHTGAFGRCIESLKIIRDAVDADTPVIGTIFTPFHIAVRLAWSRLPQDCRTEPEKVAKGLSTIASNLVAYIGALRKEVGLDGILLGAFGGENEWLPEAEYAKYAAPHDRTVLAAMKGLPCVIVHGHGEKGAHFDHFEKYDCNALSWEDRSGGPSLAEARAKTSKCLVGGVDHHMAQHGSPDAVYRQAREAIEVTGGRNFILAPGCTFLEHTPAENMLALLRASRDAAEMA